MNPARVLVLDRRGRLATELARAAAGLDPAPEILRLPRPTQAPTVAGELEPEVVVAAPEEMTGTGLRRLAQLHRAHPRSVILLCPNGRPVSVRDAAACGASDVLPYPTTPGRMRVKLREALEMAGELQPAPVAVPEQPQPPPAARTGRVLTVTSASGGCGKTFFATNMAAYLARATGGRVLLVDLDLQFGEVAVSLRLKPERTIAELVEEDDPSAVLGEYVVRHDTGFDVLCAPPEPVASERIGPREATAVLDAARCRYDHIVVDTPPALNEVVLAAFDASAALVVMATVDVPSLRNLRVFLETLDRLKLPAEDVSILLNKAERGTGIDLAQVERVYPMGFTAVLPYDAEVTRSINAGAPVIATAPDAEVSRRLVAGAGRLVPPAEGVTVGWGSAPTRRRSVFARLFRRQGRSER